MTKHDDQKPKQKGHRPEHHQKKVFDVVRPGKAPASPNSRSVIVGHKPQVHDDQFVPSEHWAGDPSEKKPLMDGRKKITLAPTGESSEQKGGAGSTVASKDGSEKLQVTTSGSLTSVKDSKSSLNKSVDPAVTTTKHFDDKQSEPKPAESRPENNGEKIDPKDPSLVALEHLMVEQVVEEPGAMVEAASSQTDSDGSRASSSAGQSEAQPDLSPDPTDDFWDKSDNSPSAATPTAPNSVSDDLLAQTDAPILEPQKAVVSQHHHGAAAWEMILIFLLVLLVGIAALNFLLDANVIQTDLQLPHTDLIGS